MTIEIHPSVSTSSICTDFDHVIFYVSSPKLVANYLCKTFGFKIYAYKGLETGSRDISATVINNGNVYFILMGAIRPLHKQPKDQLIDNIHKHIATHGDSVKDVAFKTSNINLMINHLKNLNKLDIIIDGPNELIDNFGTIKTLTIKGFNDTTHTLIDRSNYNGFLPGYKLINDSNDLQNSFIKMDVIDHCVQNQDWNQMINTCNFYKEIFNFHVFWSVDENQIFTQYSALKSTVMTNENESIKMPVNEPAIGLKKSQIEEFIEFNNGSGIQHIAIKVDNIIDTIKKMRDSGAEFIKVPDEYYINLENRLKQNKHPKIKETLKSVKKLGILVDFDENGYLLQLFTKPIFERPSFFFEIIQRCNHNGFGAGNFKGLFEVLEKDQEKRGNLTLQDVTDRTKGLSLSSPSPSSSLSPSPSQQKLKNKAKKEITDDDIADAVNYLA